MPKCRRPGPTAPKQFSSANEMYALMALDTSAYREASKRLLAKWEAKEKLTKGAFKKGDRVRVYGGILTNPTHNYQYTGHFLTFGKIGIVTSTALGPEELSVRIIEDGMVSTRSLMGKIVQVHSKQCRRLKPKEKARNYSWHPQKRTRKV